MTNVNSLAPVEDEHGAETVSLLQFLLFPTNSISYLEKWLTKGFMLRRPQEEHLIFGLHQEDAMNSDYFGYNVASNTYYYSIKSFLKKITIIDSFGE